jgi:hypothetical protein
MGGGDGLEYVNRRCSRICDPGFADEELGNSILEKTKGPVVFAAVSRPNRRGNED